MKREAPWRWRASGPLAQVLVEARSPLSKLLVSLSSAIGRGRLYPLTPRSRARLDQKLPQPGLVADRAVEHGDELAPRGVVDREHAPTCHHVYGWLTAAATVNFVMLVSPPRPRAG